MTDARQAALEAGRAAFWKVYDADNRMLADYDGAVNAAIEAAAPLIEAGVLEKAVKVLDEEIDRVREEAASAIERDELGYVGLLETHRHRLTQARKAVAALKEPADVQS